MTEIKPLVFSPETRTLLSGIRVSQRKGRIGGKYYTKRLFVGRPESALFRVEFASPDSIAEFNLVLNFSGQASRYQAALSQYNRQVAIDPQKPFFLGCRDETVCLPNTLFHGLELNTLAAAQLRLLVGDNQREFKSTLSPTPVETFLDIKFDGVTVRPKARPANIRKLPLIFKALTELAEEISPS